MKNNPYVIFGIILLILIVIVFVTYRAQENAKNTPAPIVGDFTNVYQGYIPTEVPLAGDNYNNDYGNIG